MDTNSDYEILCGETLLHENVKVSWEDLPIFK